MIAVKSRVSRTRCDCMFWFEFSIYFAAFDFADERHPWIKRAMGVPREALVDLIQDDELAVRTPQV